METQPIVIFAEINAPIEKVWHCWTNPSDIMQWNAASEDWHCPNAENDLQVGGKFTYTMASKDGSFSFGFGGEYTEVIPQERIAYVLGDERKVIITFEPQEHSVLVTETFDPETENSRELQQSGWQAILNNFKKHTEQSI